MNRKHTEKQLAEIYERAFDALMNGNSKHDLAQMYWDTLTEEEKLAYGED